MVGEGSTGPAAESAGGFIPYEEVPHTADWALRARGRTLTELFVNAARGMYALLTEEPPAAAPVSRTVAVEAASPEGLLVAWLNELLYLTERERLVFTAFHVRELAVPGWEPARPQAAPGEEPPGTEAARLQAEVAGDRIEAGLRKYIKAATYHNLAIARRDGLYETVVVFDV